MKDWRETVLIACTLWGLGTLPFVIVGAVLIGAITLVQHLQIGWRP
jgi:hypothetical protein